MTPFGERLRQLRREKGISQKDLADALGVSAAYLSALEHGKRGRPSFVLVERIIGHFNIIWDEADAMRDLAQRSHPRTKIDTASLPAQATALANALERAIADLDDQALSDLQERLDKHLRRIAAGGKASE